MTGFDMNCNTGLKRVKQHAWDLLIVSDIDNNIKLEIAFVFFE